MMKKVCVVLVLVAALVYCCYTDGLPRIGSHVAGPNIYLSRYYILHSKEDTGSDNMVTAVLADYRGFDTMCETTVLFLAGLSTVLLLYKGKRKNASTPLDKLKKSSAEGDGFLEEGRNSSDGWIPPEEERGSTITGPRKEGDL